MKSARELIQDINENKFKILKIGGALAAGITQKTSTINVVQPSTEMHVMADGQNIVLVDHTISANGLALELQLKIYNIQQDRIVNTHAFTGVGEHQPFRGHRGFVGSFLLPDSNRLAIGIERDSYWNGPYSANENGRRTLIQFIDLNNLSHDAKPEIFGTSGHGTINVYDNHLVICTNWNLNILKDGKTPLYNFNEIVNELPRSIKSAIAYHPHPASPVIYTVNDDAHAPNILRRHDVGGRHYNKHEILVKECDKILKLMKKDRSNSAFETIYTRLMNGRLALTLLPAYKRYPNSFDISSIQTTQVTFDNHRANERVTNVHVLEYNAEVGTESLLAETETPRGQDKIFNLYFFNTHFMEKLGKIELPSPMLQHTLFDGSYLCKDNQGLSTVSCHHITPQADLKNILNALLKNSSVKEFTFQGQILNQETFDLFIKLQQERKDLILHLPFEIMTYLNSLAQKTPSVAFPLMPQIEEVIYAETSEAKEAPSFQSPRSIMGTLDETLLEDENVDEVKNENPPSDAEVLQVSPKSSSYAKINKALPQVAATVMVAHTQVESGPPGGPELQPELSEHSRAKEKENALDLKDDNSNERRCSIS